MAKIILRLHRDNNRDWQVTIHRDGWINTYPLQAPETTPYRDAIDYMQRICESTNAAESTLTVE